MNAVVFYCSLVMCVSRVFSVTISTPPMQRKNLGESCTFRWNVTGSFTTYSIKLLSSGSPMALGSNTNYTFNGKSGMVTLFIWNIQTSNAGYYSLSIPIGPSTEVTSTVALFVYNTFLSYATLVVGRNPGFDGDEIELNCSATSSSLPVEYRTKMYYSWYNSFYGNLRNISTGPTVLLNGDVLPGYSLKNDGKTLLIASAKSIDASFTCLAQEEGSPYRSSSYNPYPITIYSKPYTYNFSPASKKFNVAIPSYISLLFYYKSSPLLTSYTNLTCVNAAGGTTDYPLTYNLMTSTYVQLSSIYLNSVNLYGNCSITLTNSNGSRTDTFEVRPPGSPDAPMNFSVQFVTHALVSLQWRCMWFNGAQQTVIIRLMDSKNDVEVETQSAPLATTCYNSVYSTLFQSNIQPETDYEASIWSVNPYGSSGVLKLAVTTTKRLIFETSPGSISVMGSQARINFSITDSIDAMMWLNVSCCVEFTTQCINKSYTIANTDNQIVYDNLPTGNEFVFDFIVCDGDGYTYSYALAILKGVRVSREGCVDPTKCYSRDGDQAQSVRKEDMVVAVIVLAVLLGVALLVLLGCCIAFLVCRSRQNSSQQQTEAVAPSTPARPKAKTRDPLEYANGDDLNKPEVDLSPTKENAYYKSLESSTDAQKQEEDYYEQVRDSIFQTRPGGTLDRPKRNRYE